MSKINTADCKKFLTDMIAKDPSIVLDAGAIEWFDFETEQEEQKQRQRFMRDATNPAKWRRISKQRANPHDLSVHDDHYGGYRGGLRVPVNDVSYVRIFALDPQHYDSAVAFMVLELKDGSLFLGEYIGD